MYIYRKKGTVYISQRLGTRRIYTRKQSPRGWLWSSRAAFRIERKGIWTAYVRLDQQRRKRGRSSWDLDMTLVQKIEDVEERLLTATPASSPVLSQRDFFPTHLLWDHSSLTLSNAYLSSLASGWKEVRDLRTITQTRLQDIAPPQSSTEQGYGYNLNATTRKRKPRKPFRP